MLQKSTEKHTYDYFADNELIIFNFSKEGIAYGRTFPVEDDLTLVSYNLADALKYKNQALTFGVFDGHCGYKTAEFASENFIRILREKGELELLRSNSNSTVSENVPGKRTAIGASVVSFSCSALSFVGAYLVKDIREDYTIGLLMLEPSLY